MISRPRKTSLQLHDVRDSSNDKSSATFYKEFHFKEKERKPHTKDTFLSRKISSQLEEPLFLPEIKSSRKASLQVEHEYFLCKVKPTKSSDGNTTLNTHFVNRKNSSIKIMPLRKTSLQIEHEKALNHFQPKPPLGANPKPERRRSFASNSQQQRRASIANVQRKASLQLEHENMANHLSEKTASKRLGLKQGEVVMDGIERIAIRADVQRKPDREPSTTSSNVRSRRLTLQEGRNRLFNDGKPSDRVENDKSFRKSSLQAYQVNRVQAWLSDLTEDNRLPQWQTAVIQADMIDPGGSPPRAHFDNNKAKLPPIECDFPDSTSFDHQVFCDDQSAQVSDVDTTTFIKKSISEFVQQQLQEDEASASNEVGEKADQMPTLEDGDYGMCPFDEDESHDLDTATETVAEVE